MMRLAPRSIAVSSFAGLGLLAACGQIQARPEYARKEMKVCAYCHINPNGGGARNPRGIYYFTHAKSFVGYDEEKVMGKQAAEKKAGPPSYKSAWTADAPAGTTRVAVADVTGDKTPRVLALGE